MEWIPHPHPLQPRQVRVSTTALEVEVFLVNMDIFEAMRTCFPCGNH